MYKSENATLTTSESTDETRQQHEHPIDDELNIHDASFRRHYQLTYADEPLDYESFFAPAYRFGFQLSEANPDLDWRSIEERAHLEWVANHQVSWESVADAVTYGWHEERNPSEHRVDHRHGAAQ